MKPENGLVMTVILLQMKPDIIEVLFRFINSGERLLMK